MAFPVDIITPEDIIFSGRVDSLVLTMSTGQMGFLTGRSPLMGTLGVGPAHLRREGESSEEYYFISGGYVGANGDKVTVLATRAIGAGDMDAETLEHYMESVRSRLEAQEEADTTSVRKNYQREFLQAELEWGAQQQAELARQRSV